jgi:hypothetical protein
MAAIRYLAVEPAGLELLEKYRPAQEGSPCVILDAFERNYRKDGAWF